MITAEQLFKEAGYVMPFFCYVQWCWDNDRCGYLRYIERAAEINRQSKQLTHKEG